MTYFILLLFIIIYFSTNGMADDHYMSIEKNEDKQQTHQEQHQVHMTPEIDGNLTIEIIAMLSGIGLMLKRK